MFKIFAPRVSRRDSNVQNFLVTKPIRVRHLCCSLCLIHLLRWRCEGWKLVHNADSFISHSFLTGWQMQRRLKIKIRSTSIETTSQTLTLPPPSMKAIVEMCDFPPLCLQYKINCFPRAESISSVNILFDQGMQL